MFKSMRLRALDDRFVVASWVKGISSVGWLILKRFAWRAYLNCLNRMLKDLV